MSVVHVVRSGALGDVLWTEPVLRQFAGRYDRVVMHTRFGEVLEGLPLPGVTIRGRLTLPARMLRAPFWRLTPGVRFVDLDMAYERRPRMHILHAYQDAAGLPRTDEYPRVPVNEPGAPWPGLPARFVAVHVEGASARNYRRVFGVDWDAVVRHVRDRGMGVVQIGLDPDRLAGAQHVATPLRHLAALLSRCEAFVGVDSGPSHIAAALGRPCLLFFGAVDPGFRHFAPLLRGEILRSPCEHAGCYHTVPAIRGPVCRLVGDAGVPKCSVHTTDAVISALDRVLAEGPRR